LCLTGGRETGDLITQDGKEPRGVGRKRKNQFHPSYDVAKEKGSFRWGGGTNFRDERGKKKKQDTKPLPIVRGGEKRDISNVLGGEGRPEWEGGSG